MSKYTWIFGSGVCSKQDHSQIERHVRHIVERLEAQIVVYYNISLPFSFTLSSGSGGRSPQSSSTRRQLDLVSDFLEFVPCSYNFTQSLRIQCFHGNKKMRRHIRFSPYKLRHKLCHNVVIWCTNRTIRCTCQIPG